MIVEVRKVRRKAFKEVRTIKGREHPQTTMLPLTEEMLGQGEWKTRWRRWSNVGFAELMSQVWSSYD